MRWFFLSLLAAALVSAQDAEKQADEQDELILKSTLSVLLDVEEIQRSRAVQDLAELQAQQMLDASQRRIIRQEARVEALKIRVDNGSATLEELFAANRELQLRVQLGFSVLERNQSMKALIDAARALSAASKRSTARSEKYQGYAAFSDLEKRMLERAYVGRFGRPLPVSAEGDTALHRALGLDHTGRIDVAVAPDQVEGQWIRQYLERRGIPYHAFRTAIPGSATAPHIHIGPGSVRYRAATPERTLVRPGF